MGVNSLIFFWICFMSHVSFDVGLNNVRMINIILILCSMIIVLIDLFSPFWFREWYSIDNVEYRTYLGLFEWKLCKDGNCTHGFTLTQDNTRILVSSLLTILSLIFVLFFQIIYIIFMFFPKLCSTVGII